MVVGDISLVWHQDVAGPGKRGLLATFAQSSYYYVISKAYLLGMVACCIMLLFIPYLIGTQTDSMVACC